MARRSMIGPGEIATASLFAMMLALGMDLSLRDFARVLRRPAAFLFGVVAQIALLPMVAFALALAAGLEPGYAVGLVLIAACPGGATSNALSQLARGDLALSVSLTAASSLVSFLTVPFIVGLAIERFSGARVGLELPFVDTALRLVTSTALPIALGMIVLRAWPRLAERTRRPLLIGATVVVIAMVVGLGVSLSGAETTRLLRSTGPAVAALVATMAAIAWLGAALLRLPRGQQHTIVIEVAIQNFNLALVVALSLLDERSFLGPALVYLPVMLIFSGLVAARGAWLATAESREGTSSP